MPATEMTRVCGECGITAGLHATNVQRRTHPDACNTLRSAVVENSPIDVTADTELAQDLYPIFVSLVDWSVKAGRTEHNAGRAAAAALRVLGVPVEIRSKLRDRFALGTRYLARREG